MASPHTKTGLLNSWKEIAAYLGRGLRTVQRWEKDAGLPVRRLASGPRAPVVAYAHEIDCWLETADEPQVMHEPDADLEYGVTSENVATSRLLRAKMVRLRLANQIKMEQLRLSILLLQQSCALIGSNGKALVAKKRTDTIDVTEPRSPRPESPRTHLVA